MLPTAGPRRNLGSRRCRCYGSIIWPSWRERRRHIIGKFWKAPKIRHALQANISAGPKNDDAISQVKENGTRWPVADIVMERYLNEEGQ